MGGTFRWVVVLLGAALVVAIVAGKLRKPDGRTPDVPHVSHEPRGLSDRLIDEEIDESFPASDAPSHWAGGVD